MYCEKIKVFLIEKIINYFSSTIFDSVSFTLASVHSTNFLPTPNCYGSSIVLYNSASTIFRLIVPKRNAPTSLLVV
jgi:hypothetical protein